MDSLTADQASLILRAVGLPLVMSEHPATRAVVAAVPSDRMTYSPDPFARNAFDLAWHIVAAEIKYLDAAASGAFPPIGASRPDTIRTPADVVAWYGDRFAPALERLKKTSGEDLLRVIDFYGIRRIPALAFVQLGMNHTIHHRGQLSTYLRPMGAKVPSIYGESYDGREAREIAQRGSA
jgi:uncharacterized damage-inducible protein DinB